MNNIPLALLIAITACGQNSNTTEEYQTFSESVDTNGKIITVNDLKHNDMQVDFTYNPASHNRGVEKPYDIYTDLQTPFQEVSFPNNVDTVLTFEKGTKLKIKANSFAVTGMPDKKVENITLRMKEFYSAADLLLNNMNTMSNGKMLETGGSVYLDARAEGMICEVAKGKTLDISFPTDDYKDDMQIFKGEWKDNSINWNTTEPIIQLDEEEVEDTIVFTIVEDMPQFPGSEQDMFDFIQGVFAFPAPPDGVERIGNVYVSFVVGTTGEVRDAKVLRGMHPIVDSAALAVMDKMPLWIPGRQRGERISVSYVIPFKVHWTGEKKADFNEQDLVKFAKYRKEKVMNYRDLDKMREMQAYIFPIDELGWINCDRFNYANPKTDLIAHFEDADLVDAKLIFKDINAIMVGSGMEGEVQFNSIPVDRNVKLIAIKKQDGEYYYASEEFNTNRKFITGLDFKKVDVNMLQHELEEIAF